MGPMSQARGADERVDEAEEGAESWGVGLDWLPQMPLSGGLCEDMPGGTCYEQNEMILRYV